MQYLKIFIIACYCIVIIICTYTAIIKILWYIRKGWVFYDVMELILLESVFLRWLYDVVGLVSRRTFMTCLFDGQFDGAWSAQKNFKSLYDITTDYF